MTATVGGVWGSLLAEGRLFSITATSDSNNVYLDTTTRRPGSNFDAKGRTEDPFYSGTVTSRKTTSAPFLAGGTLPSALS